MQSHNYTSFGNVRLTDVEIKQFIDLCRAKKPEILKEIQAELNYGLESTPGAIAEAQQMFKFLSQDNVLIVPRHRTASYSANNGAFLNMLADHTQQSFHTHMLKRTKSSTIIQRCTSMDMAR